MNCNNTTSAGALQLVVAKVLPSQQHTNNFRALWSDSDTFWHHLLLSPRWWFLISPHLNWNKLLQAVFKVKRLDEVIRDENLTYW